jgi:hypothetical protein
MGVCGQRHVSAAMPPGNIYGSHCANDSWASRPVWTGAKNLAFTEIICLDRPTRMESQHRPRYTGPPLILTFRHIQHCSLGVTNFLNDTFITSWLKSKGSINSLKYIELLKLLKLLQRMNGTC